jgi:hypothetical protein
MLINNNSSVNRMIKFVVYTNGIATGYGMEYRSSISRRGKISLSSTASRLALKST